MRKIEAVPTIARNGVQPVVTVTFTVDPNTGNISSSIPPGLSIPAIGAMILTLQHVANAVITGMVQQHAEETNARN